MHRFVRYAVLGLCFSAASLTATKPVAAQPLRWRNLDETNGKFYLGVAGGALLDRETSRFYLNAGTNIVVWTKPGAWPDLDQSWRIGPEWTTTLRNVVPNRNDQTMCLSLANDATAQGTQVIIRECDTTPSGIAKQTWSLISPAAVGAPFAEQCKIFFNAHSQKVLGVSGGTVSLGKKAIIWPFFVGSPGSSSGWHKDQFWCYENA